jgi:hypothetical protein
MGPSEWELHSQVVQWSYAESEREPLRDGSILTGTPAVIDVLIGLLNTTTDPRWVMQFDAIYLSPTIPFRADGSFGGLVPGATLVCKENRDAPCNLNGLAAAVGEAS